MCQRTRTSMPCQPASVRAARQWTARQLDSMYAAPGETADGAALVVSELVTNCVRSAAHDFVLTLEAHHNSLRVEAHDDAPGAPIAPHPVDPYAASGRGLLIVASIANDWGVRDEPPGKTVWAELVMAPTAAPGFACTRTIE